LRITTHKTDLEQARESVIEGDTGVLASRLSCRVV
jgi:hypothetical protein